MKKICLKNEFFVIKYIFNRPGPFCLYGFYVSVVCLFEKLQFKRHLKGYFTQK